jgi:hypothetical protein
LGNLKLQHFFGAQQAGAAGAQQDWAAGAAQAGAQAAAGAAQAGAAGAQHDGSQHFLHENQPASAVTLANRTNTAAVNDVHFITSIS